MNLQPQRLAKVMEREPRGSVAVPLSHPQPAGALTWLSVVLLTGRSYSGDFLLVCSRSPIVLDLVCE